MRKTISIFTLLFILFFSFSVSVKAAAQLDCVTDTAQLLTREEWEDLETRAKAIAEEYDFGVYVLTVDDYTDYVSTRDIEECAEEVYEEYALGVGPEQSGLLLMLSLDGRNCALITRGSGNTAFTAYGKSYLKDRFLEYFREDNWYGGFCSYLESSSEILELAAQGTPLDQPEDTSVQSYGAAAGLVIGCLLLVVAVVWIFRKKIWHKETAEEETPECS